MRVILLAVLLSLGISTAGAIDLRQSPDYRSAVYSFHETFPDTLRQDTLNYATVRHFEQLYPDTLWTGWLERGLTNEDGSLSWRRSRDLMSLLVLYQVTGDPRHLGRTWRFCRDALAVRDDLVGKADFRGRVRPVWGSTRYGSGRRSSFIIHTALIVEPILTTLAILEGKLPDYPQPPKDDPIWKEATATVRSEMLAATLASLDVFDPQWHEGPGPGEGLYVANFEEESREDTPEPFNRQNLMAWDHYLAYLLTGDELRRERATKLATFFRNRLEHTEADCYLWEYEPVRWEHRKAEPMEPVSSCDDISHGWHALDPVVKLARVGCVFDPQDLGRFARTLTRSIYQGDGVFFGKLGCSPVFNKVLLDALPGWLCVAEGDPQVLPLIRSFMYKHVPHPQALHLAYLIRLESSGGE
ncbi:MAG: hypothetical protein IT349_05315 [Candidatus Eisenbacteria bacterium]|nr:hypothetical protein [Candidatus Eisenbacteria bacterium]MCC7141504.1 hypothetical protein [Candidatus Eisenbacteria bacterium]